MIKTTTEGFFHIELNDVGEKSIFKNKEHTLNKSFINSRLQGLLNPDDFPYPLENQDLYKGSNWLDFIDKLDAKSLKYIIGNEDRLNDFIQKLNYNSFFMNARYFEPIFEKIRAEGYPDLPSRFNSIYVCEGVEELKFWYFKLREQSGRTPFKIYQLNLYGRIHKCDSNILELGILPDDKIIEKAHDYWKGKLENQPNPENLFFGTFSVIRSFSSIDEI